MFILSSTGRLVSIVPSTEAVDGSTVKEFSNGVWDELKSPMLFGELMEEGSRDLSEEEVVKLVKSGKFN